ncbi:MAG: hypothetical protein WAV86_07715 [Lutibacter sp.]
MKKKLIFSLFLLFSIICSSQTTKTESASITTKMDAFASKTGIITKFTDSNLEGLKTTYGAAEARIRKVNSGTITTYFYQIEKEGKYGSSTASIEYSDLLEIIKAMATLKLELEKDMVNIPDYLENKFVTVDGFQVGYYISKGESQWYLKLEKYGSDNTLFINDPETIESSFNQAKDMILKLKG